MDERTIESTLGSCEAELAAARAPDLRASGFWRAVAAVKKRPELVARYADRIAKIDRDTFRRRVRLVFPRAVGLAFVAGGLIVSLLLLAAAGSIGHPWREILLLVGAAGLDVVTHGLGHLVVGEIAGIRFTDWFIDIPRRPQPGFKVDYASYLRARPRGRAWMHAAGAIATKLTPFLVIPYASAIGADTWAIAVLAIVGVLQIVSDALYSVKASDWKKFRREWRLAR